jgi:hypothetical protein
VKKGNLTAGYGAGDDRLGPELMFGHVVGEALEPQVLLIKAAWGGKSLAEDFRPPSAGGQVGPNYNEMIEIVRDVLENLETHFPEYEGQGYELAGFVWFQGWNDMIDANRVAEYESNLVHFIQDVRRDLNAPDLRFVIGELGVGGETSAPKNSRMADFRKAQAAAAARAEFRDNVIFVPTTPYWDQVAHDFLEKNWVNRKWASEEAKQHFETMGNQPPYHYLGSAKIYSLMGYAFAKAALQEPLP